MPLGKYYCDYCDKQFQDTTFARKRHISGSQHQRARALWYDSFKDPHGGFLRQPDGSLSAGVCHHFVRMGTCKYGDACKYFHPVRNVVGPPTTILGSNFVQPPPTFGGNQILTSSSLTEDTVRDRSGMSWGNLPPSLRPPPEGGYPPLPFVDWG